MSFPIIYQDSEILILNKPAGVVVDKSETQNTNTVEDFLREELNISLARGGIVHRLDKDTSGVLLVAKTQAALESLQSQFKNRQTKKQYIALVHGDIKEGGVVNAPIMRNPFKRENFIVSEEGKESVTEYQPEKLLVMSNESMEKVFNGFNKIQLKKLFTTHYPLFTLINCFPQTGRTHQIRVHLKHIGFPIVGDDKYGGRKTARLDKRWCPRQFLHAEKLEFTRPTSGERVSFAAELPDDLKQALEYLS